MFETFSSEGPSEFLVVSGTRWDKHQKRMNAPWQQNSSSSSNGRQRQAGLEEQRVSWISSERKVMVDSGRLPGKMCADIKVDIEVMERLIEPEDKEVCPRYILKYSTRGGSNIFQL